jgi:hypothetical protein
LLRPIDPNAPAINPDAPAIVDPNAPAIDPDAPALDLKSLPPTKRR